MPSSFPPTQLSCEKNHRLLISVSKFPLDTTAESMSLKRISASRSASHCEKTRLFINSRAAQHDGVYCFFLKTDAVSGVLYFLCNHKHNEIFLLIFLL